MKPIIMLPSHQIEKKPATLFFPRIIREFEDNDESMYWS
jgi:hypothetical protein